MLYYDYEWDIGPNYIKFDRELNIDKLGWNHGDYFKVINVDGQAMLVKCDPLVKFLNDGRSKDE